MSPGAAGVLTLAASDAAALRDLLAGYGLTLTLLEPGAPIPGSFWGEREAGLRGQQLYARPDTPVHSVLHEAAHFVCMDAGRRAVLDRDAGGSDLEEAAVCYLQLLLAAQLTAVGRERLLEDMDAWGYSFRLGSTRAWAEEDAQDARDWLAAHGITDARGALTGELRR